MTKRICAERTCRDCGADIEDLPKGTQRCLDCVMDMMHAALLEPLEPYPGPNTPWLCRCLRCGGDAKPRFGNIVCGTSNGCRNCGIATKANRCRTPEAAAIACMRAAGLEPLEPYKNNWTPWLCECLRCGERRTPTLHNVQGGHGCGNCAPRGGDGGFRVDEDAIVYLLSHGRYGSVKVGVANDWERRLHQHHKCGWETVLVVDVPGTVAWRTERAILDWWRKDLGLVPHLGPQEMPQGGWTETVAAADIDLMATMDFIRQLALAG